MKLFIGLVTEDQALRNYFSRRKEWVVPRDSLDSGALRGRSLEVTLASWRPETSPTRRGFERFLLGNLDGVDGCMLLVDSRSEDNVADVRWPTFTVVFDHTEIGTNPRNFFHHRIGRALRSFGQLLVKFERGDDRKLLLLPLRNFDAAELTELARLCRDECLSATFDQNVEAQLTGLRSRVRPRRKTSYNTQYAVDDRDRFFHYGLERHAQFPTGAPHHPFCEVAGRFRFGHRVDERRHFNVSEGEGDRTQIAGSFRDCHGKSRTVKKKTHLNMFCNDAF